MFELAITPVALVASGVLVLGVVIFQYLEGSRVIHFKGRLHLKVHKTGAIVLLTGAVFHAALALIWVLL